MKKDASILATLTLVGVTLLSGLILVSSKASAEDSATTTASVTVPVACSMAGHTDTAHNASLIPGTYSGASGSEYEQGIGKTTLTTFCNDNNGFSIYAIGFTGDSYDGENHTKLVGTSVSGNATIPTKVYESSDTTSNWSMKVTKVDDSTKSYNPANMSITNSFNNWHIVPDTYTKVAEYHATTGSSTTDTALGAKVETTYASYIAPTQPADTYTGKVKYTMVHPYNEQPLTPQTTASGKICYYPNFNATSENGTMGCQTIPTSGTTDGVSPTSATLLASNFSREGYGFAGWSNKYDYATNPNQEGIKFYGPQETITYENGEYVGEGKGLSLYAIWVKSEGSLQDTDKVASVCSRLTAGATNLSSVSALTDQRDNQTYAIARLADGKCWMIENLRLESTNSDNATGALAQGYGASTTYGNFGGLADAENSGFSSTYTANSLYYSGTQEGTASINIGTTNLPGYRMPRYNNTNTSTRASSPTNNSGNIYSYGNYYTWHAAMANTTYYDSPTATDADGKTSETVNTSLCPTGWRLPYGNNTGNGTVAGGFYNLNYKINNDSNVTDSTASLKLRSFPNNFLYSGGFVTSSAYHRGSNGDYWSSTAVSDGISYGLYLDSSNVVSGIVYISKNYGRSIRCTTGS